MCVVHLYLLFYGYGYDLADTFVPSKLLLLYFISLRSTHTVTICATFYVYHWYCTNFKSVCTGMYIVSFFIFLFFFLFFEGMTDLGKKRKARIVKKIWVENQKVNLILTVYLGVLPILKEYVMVFQVSIFLYSVCNSA